MSVWAQGVIAVAWLAVGAHAAGRWREERGGELDLEMNPMDFLVPALLILTGPIGALIRAAWRGGRAAQRIESGDDT